jgi:hypothetical protein
MAKVDQLKIDNTAKRIERFQAKVLKMQAKLQKPDLTEGEIFEIEEAIANFEAKIDKLGGGAPSA